MSNLEHLRQATENTLHELTADESLKFKIVSAAADSNVKNTHLTHLFHPIPLLCSIFAILLICVLTLNTLQPIPTNIPGELNSFTAGSSDSDASSVFPDGFSGNSVSSINLNNNRLITDQNVCSLLIDILHNQTVPAKPAEKKTYQGSIIITTSDDDVYSFDLQNPFLISQDGKWWSCSEFFTELEHISNVE